MFEIKDQIGKMVQLKQYPPRRIISLVPSITELLHDLGLDDEVVGITKFCVHPQSWFKTKPRIGGTKNVSIEKITSLQPDLIIANKEENVKEQIEQVSSIAPVWVSDNSTFDAALQMIESIGKLTGQDEKANEITNQIQTDFERNSNLQNSEPGESALTGNWQPISCCYLVWRDPYMTIGGDTFISDMMHKCGLRNVFENAKRYPQVSLEQITEKQPQFILLSSEPYPFRQPHLEEIKAVLPQANVLMVDGEMFSWYGSRMLYAAQYYQELRERIFQIVYNHNSNAC